MDKELKVGIAGYGVVGKRRRFFVDRNPLLKTVALCDRTFENSGAVENGVRHHTNYKNLLEEDLDILLICMSNDMAVPVTIAGLERGLHVFCEKPPARNIQELAQVFFCEQRHPTLKLKYGFNHRYHDSVRDALAIVCSKELGSLINLRGVYGKSKMVDFHSDWRSQRAIAGGGILLDQGIHMVDLMRLFAGEFRDVHSIVSNSFWNHDVEDNAYAMMKTDGGVVGLLHSSATQWRHRFHLDITLERGTVILSGILSGTKSYGAETLTVTRVGKEDEGNPREVTTNYNRDNSWQDEITNFVEAIRENKPIKDGSSLDALKTLHLVCRIYCADPVWRTRYNLDDTLPNEIKQLMNEQKK